MATKRHLSTSELESLIERLTKTKTNASPSTKQKQQGPAARKQASLSQKELDALIERLSAHKKAMEPVELNRGEKASAIYIDRLIDRLTANINNKSDAEKNSAMKQRSNPHMTNEELTQLVQRLSNKEVAMEKTPDTKRIPDKTFGIVTSYAWNNNNFQALLTNIDSP
eukprot:gene9732-10726_t